MKKPKRKSTKILIAVSSALAVVAFFVAVAGVMAVNGKIDVSGIPLLGNIVTELKNGSVDSTYATEQTVTPSEEYTSITDVAVSGNSIYAADKTGQKLYRLNASGEILASYAANTQVNGVAVNGEQVYALLGSADGAVAVLTADLKPEETVAVGHTTSAMAVYGNKAYVADRFDNSVSVIDLATNTVIATIPIDGREPIDLAVAAGKLYVACHLPDEASDDTVVAANVAVINLATDSVEKTINLVNGAGGVKGITASPDGQSVYVSHIIARYTYPTTQLDRGWINTNGFSVIDTAFDTPLAIMLDEVELGAANPWGIALSEDGNTLVVALSGTDEVMLVDLAKMNEKINAVKNGTGVVESADKIVDYLSFLDDCRTRISLSGKGARAVTVSGNTAYIGQYFTGDIATVELSSCQTATLCFVNQPENDAVRSGEILFSDANNCYQKWQSCLSCHPDAQADGLNWDNLNDGLGNPKSAKSMVYSHRTPPVMVTGIRNTAETAVRAGMKFIQFNVLDETQMGYIDQYLKSLQPEQSPYLNTDGTLTESALRGKALFESQGCAECHPAPLYTDLKTHDVGTNDTSVNWENRAFDTPTLVEVWRTSGWLHDGRYNNMFDVVKHFAPDLSDSDATDLANFVLSIGAEDEQYGVEQVYTVLEDTTSVCKLVAGGSIKGFTIRCQQENAAASVTVTAVLKNAAGETLKSASNTVTNLAFNTAKQIDLSGFTVPESDAEGTTLTITFTDAAGEQIATPYVLKY